MFLTHSLKASGLMGAAVETTMFGVAPFSKNLSLCCVAALSAMSSGMIGVSQDMPRKRARVGDRREVAYLVREEEDLLVLAL